MITLREENLEDLVKIRQIKFPPNYGFFKHYYKCPPM